MASARRWEGHAVSHWRRAWELPLLEVHDRIGSTNDLARELAEDAAPNGSVVLADLQTDGRGRQGRRWHAPPGTALLLSLVLRPDRDSAAASAPGAAPLRVGLAVARAIESAAPVEVGIKWPNDLVVDTGRDGRHYGGGPVERSSRVGRPDKDDAAADRSRKLAGILCEASLTGARPYIVAGIGINVSQQPDEWPDDVRDRAVSLMLASGREISRAELANAMIAAVLAVAKKIARPLDTDELRELSGRDTLLGRRVIAHRPFPVVGVAAGIEAGGMLRIREDNGRMVPVYEATVRRTDHDDGAERKPRAAE